MSIRAKCITSSQLRDANRYRLMDLTDYRRHQYILWRLGEKAASALYLPASAMQASMMTLKLQNESAMP